MNTGPPPYASPMLRDDEIRQDVTSNAIVRAEGVHKRFGQLEVLRGVSFSVNLHETVAVIGPSGSGKSTMLRCINMLEDWQGGHLYFDGKHLGYDLDSSGRQKRWSARRKASTRQEIGMVFQQFNLFPHMTALANVVVGPQKIKRIPASEAHAVAMDFLEQVGLADKVNNYPAELSGGQQQRVAIARALAMQPKVVLLDEITSALDPELVGEVLEVISRLREQGMTMILVTHEIQFATEVASKVIFMDNGEIVEEGPPHEVVSHPKSERLVRFLHRFQRSHTSEEVM